MDDTKPVTNLLYLGRSSELRIQVERLLHKGSRFEYFDDLDDACSRLGSKNCNTEILVISDLNDLSPLGVLLKIKKAQRSVPVIVLSENKKSSLAIEIIKAGAYDFFLLPVATKELLDSINQALVDSRLTSKPVEIGEVFSDQDTIIGRSRAMRDIYKQLGRIASQSVTVLVRGETGTGKELIARAIYQHGHRAHEGFIAVNCAAIPENLLESELFGHEKGAFTGASYTRVGRFEQAHGGTIFLDEIGDLDQSLQVKLLRVLQERTIQRLGSSKNIPVDVRVIAATHRNLESMISEGTFREDLFYRLNVISVEIPALRDRREDIPDLVIYFLQKFAAEYGLLTPNFSKKAAQYLTQLEWPGNIRQLQNVISKALLNSKSKTLDVEHFDEIIKESKISANKQDQLKKIIENEFNRVASNEIDAALPILTEKFEREVYTMAIERSGGNQAKAARLLGVSRFTLREKLKLYGKHPNTKAKGW
ncbi:MAG: sigma-54 dependent transcriptional regulator [Verrucomicrobiota bacterium]|nr:sigma-54 dependent transcriptional regulator [Verrucomicrobiota bacterium]